MTKRVITISRAFGSGGRTIGKEVAKRLGIPYYDKELVDKVAEESGFHADFIEEAGEYAPVTNSFLFNIAVSPNPMAMMNHMSMADQLFVCQTNVIRKLADEGPCVIIGRCADYILQDDPDLISLFITAPFKARVERIKRLHPEYPKENYETHAELVRKTDRIRSTYYNYHTDREWGNVRNYHLVVDATKLGVDGTVEMLADYVKHAVG